MAITKIHPIKATVSKAITYICDPAKTDEGILITTHGCSEQTASFDFKFALSKTRQSDPNQAFHLIQSFSPGEVDFKTAHRIGNELANRLLEGKYSYVVSTHIEKNHIHNHIIFCAADNIEHQKYHDCKKSYYHIRSLSDHLCKENNLSVIVPGLERGKNYKDWQTARQGNNLKSQLQMDIDTVINQCNSYEDFIDLLKAKGYEIKGESLTDSNLKYISFRPLDGERFFRGSERSLGAEYTRDRINERIMRKAISPTVSDPIYRKKKETPFKKRKSLTSDYSKKYIIDTTSDKFQTSPGLSHWASIQNLKIAASSYAEAESLSALKEKIASKEEVRKVARTSIITTEKQLKELGEIIKYAEDYVTHHPIHFRYEKSKDPDRYFRQHETELILYDGAVNMLKRFGINPKSINLEQMKSDYSALQLKKLELQKSYKSAERDISELEHKSSNIQKYMQQEEPTQAQTKKNEQSL